MTDGPYNVHDLVRDEVTIRCVARDMAEAECVRLNGEAESAFGDLARFEVRHAEGLPLDGVQA